MEQYMNLKSFIISLTLIFALALNAGTIIYKTSSKSEEHILPKVKIVSISERTITIKHGGGVRTIPLSYLIGYYDTDIEAGSFRGQHLRLFCNYQKKSTCLKLVMK